MAITPDTNLYLLKVPIQIDNKNQLTFNNKNEQINYFMSLDSLEVNNFSYQRKDSIIRYPEHIDSILEYNYCIYQNENYSDKWFFAFITNMRYVNDSMTEITILSDVWQTWQFDLQFKECFVEREMINVAEDIPGANLLPEGLETGEFVNHQSIDIADLEPIYIIAFTGENIATLEVPQNGYKYNGIYSSITFIATNNIKNMLNQINTDGNGDKIFTVFTIPKLAIKDILPDDLSEPWTENLTYDFMQGAINMVFESVPSSLDGYLPRNQKLKTYPYCYFGFNPTNGTPKIFRYENFKGQPTFKAISEINPNPNVSFIPQNYKNIENNVSEVVSLAGYPTISYKNDYFNTWLAQNSEIVQLQINQEQYNYETGIIQNTLNSVGSMFTKASKGDTSALTDGFNIGFDVARSDVNHQYYIKNQMAQIEKQKLLPDSGTLSSNNATLIGYNYLSKNIFTSYTIKKQFAERIDKFFDCYGYLTNKFKIPNLNNRVNWNYIKTTGCNIVAHIPQTELQIIENMFDNGLTLWHNPSTFLDYSQNNTG